MPPGCKGNMGPHGMRGSDCIDANACAPLSFYGARKNVSAVVAIPEAGPRVEGFNVPSTRT